MWIWRAPTCSLTSICRTRSSSAPSVRAAGIAVAPTPASRSVALSVAPIALSTAAAAVSAVSTCVANRCFTPLAAPTSTACTLRCTSVA